MHEVEQVIKPATRISRRPTVKLGLHPRYPRGFSSQQSGSASVSPPVPSTTPRALSCVSRPDSGHLARGSSILGAGTIMNRRQRAKPAPDLALRPCSGPFTMKR
jgi:hypothetical protein